MEDENPKRAWYMLHTYPGKEETLRDNLRKRLGQAGMLDRLFDIVVPMQGRNSIPMIKDGKVQTIYPTLFPGTVFVLMALDEDTWNVVRQTPGITGFVGSGDKPRAYYTASPSEVSGQTVANREGKPPVQKGDRVRILSGPFYDFRGVVIHVDAQRSTMRVMVDFYKTPTPVEIGFEQAAKE